MRQFFEFVGLSGEGSIACGNALDGQFCNVFLRAGPLVEHKSGLTDHLARRAFTISVKYTMKCNMPYISKSFS